MRIGMTIPFMEPGWTREAMKAWALEIDRGPWAHIAMGERITFVNPEFMTSLAATAAWTERVELVSTISVLTMHNPVLMAKQFATIDVISNGRLTVGIGTGGGVPQVRGALRRQRLPGPPQEQPSRRVARRDLQGLLGEVGGPDEVSIRQTGFRVAIAAVGEEVAGTEVRGRAMPAAESGSTTTPAVETEGGRALEAGGGMAVETGGGMACEVAGGAACGVESVTLPADPRGTATPGRSRAAEHPPDDLLALLTS